MKLFLLALFFLQALPAQLPMEEALEKYNQAFRSQDVTAIRDLLAE